MTQLVFIHGPGAGGCADAWAHQLKKFPGSVAPTLPDLPGASTGADVTRYMEWVRGWLAAQDMREDLLLVGYTLGAAIALQFALDYPQAVKGLVLSAVSVAPRAEARSGLLDSCLKAATGNARAVDAWLEFHRQITTWVAPELRAHLLTRQLQVGPMSQHRMLLAIYGFDVRERIESLRTPLLLIRGADDVLNPPPVERELHAKIPGSRFVSLPQAGHFPATERPEEVNRMIGEFIAEIDRGRS